jgi:Hemerythrin HHE cation binding domain
MRPDDVRRILIGQHVALREHLETASVLARDLVQGTTVGTAFREVLIELQAIFAAHNRCEETWLEPILRPADPIGRLRVARMFEEHRAEHQLMAAALTGDDLTVARRMPDLAEDLLAHMEAEERTVLHPAVLCDPPDSPPKDEPT